MPVTSLGKLRVSWSEAAVRQGKNKQVMATAVLSFSGEF